LLKPNKIGRRKVGILGFDQIQKEKTAEEMKLTLLRGKAEAILEDLCRRIGGAGDSQKFRFQMGVPFLD
jgi:hypothetical protein